MKNTFDISKFSAEDLKRPATYGQITALSYRLCGSKGGKLNYQFATQIRGCLYNNSKAGKFTFGDANKLFDKKKLPVKFQREIRAYLAHAD